MTNPIPAGTRNIVINVPEGEHSLLGREAFQSGAKSVAEFLRNLWLAGADRKDPELAARLREVRRQYYGAAMLVLLCSALAAGADSVRVLRVRAGRTKRTEEALCEEAVQLC